MMRWTKVVTIQLTIFALGTYMLLFHRYAFRLSIYAGHILEGDLSDQPDILVQATNNTSSNDSLDTISTSNASAVKISSEFLSGYSSVDTSNVTKLWGYLDSISTINPGHIPEINFFVSNKTEEQQKGTAAACLINLDDTIKLAEWLPYNYAIVPLGSLVIALDPNTSAKGVRRTLELMELWKEKIDITLWPSFILPDKKRKRKKIPYVRERQVYFAKECLIHHKRHNRSWTLLNDNDEFLLFNYINSDEKKSIYHLRDKNKRKRIDAERKRGIPLRKKLPAMRDETIIQYLDHQNVSNCIRLPYITYGGSEIYKNFTHTDIVPPEMLSTIQSVHHEIRHGKASKVMIDLSQVGMDKLVKGNGRTIHNPNSLVCGKNGASDSGTDYMSAVLRMNHYIGSIESFFERQGDYRRRDTNSYQKRASAVNVTVSHFDFDIVPWMDVFVSKVGKEQAQELLAPLSRYIQEERQLQARQKKKLI